MAIKTKKMGSDDQTTEGADRFETFVNGKNQGVIVGVKDKGGKIVHWAVEGDPYNKTYASSDEATVAAAAQNTGRKVEVKEKNKRKRKKEKYSKK